MRIIGGLGLIDKYESSTSVRKEVFEQFIQPELTCSYQAFNNMLNVVNPQKEIDLLTNKI